MKTLTSRALLASSALVAAMPFAAHAQTASASVTEGSADIIVTAQRRDESLSKTPVAVQVVSGEQLAKAEIRTQNDLRMVAPGLSIRSGVDSNELNYAVRGQSKDPLADNSPGVLPYYNEVPIGGGKVGSVAFYDLASVQLLKGPQGTLFGRSSTGGAVLQTTTRPKNEVGGYIGASLGDYALRQVDGAVDLPLVNEKVLLRVAGIYRERNGFQRNIFKGGDVRLGDTQRWGFRPTLVLDLGSFKNETIADYLHTKGASLQPTISGLLPFTGVGAPFVPAEILYGGTAPAARAAAIAVLGAFGVPASAAAPYYDAYFAPGSGHPAGGLAQVSADQLARGPFKINIDGRPSYHGNNEVVANITTLDIGADTQLKNVFGYARSYWKSSYDSDGTPFGLGNDYLANPITGVTIDGFNSEHYREISEELQLQGTILNGKLSYTTGLYFSDENRNFFNYQPFFDILLGGSVNFNSYRQNGRSYAVYAQGTYKLNDDGLSVTGGMRYTIDKIQKITNPDDGFRVTNPVAPAGYSYDQRSTFKKVAYQIGIQDQVNSNLLVYAVHRRAYKPGGFNGTVFPKNGSAQFGGDQFEAEKVIDVEVGTKFQGHIGDVPARMSLAAFHTWNTNSQRLAFTLIGPNPSSLTVNIPKGKTTGLEIEGVIKPQSWLSLGANGNYIKATYSADTVFVNGDPQIYNQVPDTPKWSGSIFADVTAPIAGDIALALHGDLYHQSVTYIVSRSGANQGATIKGYSVANFRAGIENDKAGWSLAVNLKNAFNKTYFTGGLATGEIFQIQTLVPAEPRTFSVDARFKF